MEKIIFQTHFYEWDGEIYKHIFGGPKGLKVTGFVARILRDFWEEKVKEMEEHYNLLASLNPIMFQILTIHMLGKYVDDCFHALNSLRLRVDGAKRTGE